MSTSPLSSDTSFKRHKHKSTRATPSVQVNKRILNVEGLIVGHRYRIFLNIHGVKKYIEGECTRSNVYGAIIKHDNGEMESVPRQYFVRAVQLPESIMLEGDSELGPDVVNHINSFLGHDDLHPAIASVSSATTGKTARLKLKRKNKSRVKRRK